MRALDLVRAAVWPIVVVGSLAGFVAGFERGFGEASLFAVPAAAILGLVFLELLLPERPGAGVLRDPQAPNDMAHGVVGQAFGNTLGQVVFVVAAAALAGTISERLGGNLWPVHWPGWLQVLALVFVADGLDYWRHRLQHTVSWLWPMHALHHSIDRLNALKSGRGHFLDMLFRNLVVYAPLVALGAPRDVMLAYAAAVTVFGPVAHANVRLPVPSFLHRLVLTPQVHRIHHARPLALAQSNYANVFPFWDILFGTFVHPDRPGRFDYGIEGDVMPATLGGQIAAPFVWNRLTRGEEPAR